MKNYIRVLISLLIVNAAMALEFPIADEPQRFNQEIKQYIADLYDEGISIGSSPSVDNQIKNDPRNWEAALAELIGDPGEYRWGPSTYALSAAKLRGKGNDPEIRQAAVQQLRYSIRKGIEMVDQKPENKRVLSDANLIVESSIAEMLEMDSPHVLQAILLHYNSPEADRLEIIYQGVATLLAPSMQKYGDMQNVEEAEKLAAKLASIGRADVASNIKRAAERIRKDAAAKQASGEGGAEEGKNVDENDDHVPVEVGIKQLWPWFAAGAAFVVALMVYFRKKR